MGKDTGKLSLRIADKDYELVLIDSKEHVATSTAKANAWLQKIAICTDDRKWDGIMASMWHEVLETLNEVYDLKLDHRTITLLGSAIHQVMRDNAGVMFELTKKGDRT